MKRKLKLKPGLELVAAGAAAGTVNGLFGTGGGTVIVLALMWMLKERTERGGEEERRIFSNAPAAVLPIAVASALTYSSFSPPDIGMAAAVAISGFIGGTVGAMLLGRVRADALKLIFSAVMIVSGGIMLLR